MDMEYVVKLKLHPNEERIVRDFYELLHDIAEQYDDFGKKDIAADFEYLGSNMRELFTQNDIMEP